MKKNFYDLNVIIALLHHLLLDGTCYSLKACKNFNTKFSIICA